MHQKYLQTKKTTTDYFSINTYYWDSIINKNFKEFSYLEIGSFEGNSASYILNNFKTSKVVCVDIWDKFDDNDKDKDENLKTFERFNSKLFKKRVFSFFKSSSDVILKIIMKNLILFI